MNRPLPPQQSKILHYFADAQNEGRQPSRAEVATHFGYAFPGAGGYASRFHPRRGSA